MSSQLFVCIPRVLTDINSRQIKADILSVADKFVEQASALDDL